MDRKEKLRILLGILAEKARKSGAIILLACGTFVLGFSTKDMQDKQERKILQINQAEMVRTTAAACDARIVANDKLVASKLALLDEQSKRLAEQGILIQMIASHQKQNTQYTRNQMQQVKRAAEEAKAAAAIAASKTTSVERQQINKVVKGK